MTTYICSCTKVLQTVDDEYQDRVIQKNIGCQECRRNHACCIIFSLDHALDFLRAVGYKIEAPK